MTENTEPQAATHERRVPDGPAWSIRARAVAAMDKLVKTTEAAIDEWAETLKAHDQEATDAEAMRVAILAALGTFGRAKAYADDYLDRAEEADYKAGGNSAVAHHYRQDANEALATAANDMAETLRALHRVPVESHEMTTAELIKHGAAPQMTIPAGRVICPECRGVSVLDGECDTCDGEGTVIEPEPLSPSERADAQEWAAADDARE